MVEILELHGPWLTEKQRAEMDLHEALIDLRDSERAVERAKQRIKAARVKLKNAE